METPVTDVINDEKAVVDLDAAPPPPGVASDELVRQLAERARAEGLRLTGEGGLLSQLTKVVVESALEGELDDHLGYSRSTATRSSGPGSIGWTRPVPSSPTSEASGWTSPRRRSPGPVRPSQHHVVAWNQNIAALDGRRPKDFSGSPHHTVDPT